VALACFEKTRVGHQLCRLAMIGGDEDKNFILPVKTSIYSSLIENKSTNIDNSVARKLLRYVSCHFDHCASAALSATLAFTTTLTRPKFCTLA